MLDRRYKEKRIRESAVKRKREKTHIWNNRDGDCVVYCLTNRINGKMYIGYSTLSVYDRWGKDGREYKGHCPAIWAAIEKYGWNNFDKRILVDSVNKTTAEEVEAFTIAFLKNKGCKLYNLTDGGDSSPMSNPEVAAKVSKAMKGENNPMKRPEVREANSEAMKEYYENHPEAREAAREANRDKMRPVEAIDPETGERVHYFESTHAAEMAGFDRRNVAKCCNRKPGYKTHHGYIWRWVEDKGNKQE